MESLNYFSLFFCVFFLVLSFCWNITLFDRNRLPLYYLLFIFKSLCLVYNIYCFNNSIRSVIDLGSLDIYNFLRAAEELQMFYGGDLWALLTSGGGIYPKIMALVFYLLGNRMDYMYLITFMVSLWTLRYVILVIREMTANDALAQNTGLFCALFPVLFTYSLQPLRECFITFFALISFYYFIRYIKTHFLFNFIFACFLSLVAAMFHSGMVSITVSYFICFIIFNKLSIRINPAKIIIAFFVLCLFIPLHPYCMNKFTSLKDVDSIEDFSETRGVTKTIGNTAYIGSIPNSTVGLVRVLPYLYAMFALAPLPWQIYSSGTAFAWAVDGLPQMIFMWITLCYLFRLWNEINLIQRKYIITFLLIVSLTYFVFALGTFNYGTAMRHRAKIAPIVIIYVMIYLDNHGYLKFFSKNR
ncbi:MAG: hypothetical protein Q4C95_07040 [Planctomycetia bacterium]|nr:hypothetical protein [Planctomycetia bacterium]